MNTRGAYVTESPRFALCSRALLAIPLFLLAVAGPVRSDLLFTEPLWFDVGRYPEQIAIADLNADGHLDLATANVGSNNASVLLGHGDGTFAFRKNYGAGTLPPSVAIADLNGD